MDLDKTKGDVHDCVHIVGAGVSGLFCANELLNAGLSVKLYDHQGGPGKKFLVAGNGGLNLTHSEELNVFCTRYGKHENFFKEALKKFSPSDLRDWCQGLGVETFVGSSGRVFPTKLKAAEILLTLRKKLEASPNFEFYLKHKFLDLEVKQNSYIAKFNGPDGEVSVEVDPKSKGNRLIFALGGGSWAKTGSDGLWIDTFKKLGFDIASLTPMNCGFESRWSNHFTSKVERLALKNIELGFKNHKLRTEVMITNYGIEGTGVYALSHDIALEIQKKGFAEISIDLKPEWSIEKILDKVRGKKSKESLNNFFRKNLALDKDTLVLLREFVDKDQVNDLEALALKIKSLKVTLNKSRPIDEAISTSGGIRLEELTRSLESKSYPGLFFAGEMLDFEAPTGGYLIQAAMSTAFIVCQEIIGP